MGAADGSNVANQFVEVLAAAGVKRAYGVAAMAEAVGIRGIRIEDLGWYRSSTEHDGPALVDAVVNRSELAVPPPSRWITMEMAKGFTLYMAKAVISGRVEKVIDPARTNMWR
jgi:pyruvate dehydrogenase (quinone)